MSYRINKVAVLGAGVMGAGIAAHLAGAGIPVHLLDIPPAQLTEEEAKKGLTLDSRQVRNRLAQAGKDRVVKPANRAIYDPELGALIQVGNFADDLRVVGEVDWVIEAVVEKLEVKKQLLGQVAALRRPGTIVSSNTSGVSIDAMAAGLPPEFRQHFLGTHFFNPPRWMKLLEIIPSGDCRPEVLAFMRDFAVRRLGKGVVVAKDTINFIANRIGAYSYMVILKSMLERGLSVPEVDELTGPLIGRPNSATFRTLDMVGLDVFYHVANNVVANAADEAEKAAFVSPDFITAMVRNGQLGDKTKQGFYKKTGEGKARVTLAWDYRKGEYAPPAVRELPGAAAAQKAKGLANKLRALVDGGGEDSAFAWEVVKKMLLYSAARIPEIADSFKDVDNAMMWGYNWEAGPFRLWDALGVEESVARMQKEGDAVPQWVLDRLHAGRKKFYDGAEVEEQPFIVLASPKLKKVFANEDASLVDIGDGVACLQFHSKSHAVTAKVVEAIAAAVDEAQRNFAGLVVGNQGKNFSVGADLALVGEWARDKKWQAIDDLAGRLQQANLLLKYCPVPVVSAPYGMTLGGGAEIVMHTYQVAAHAETYLGLVEFGVGLVPAGGGVKEMVVRHTQEAFATGNDPLPNLRKVWETVAQAKVSASAHDAVKLGFLTKRDQVVMSRDFLIDEAKQAVLYLAARGFRPLWRRPVKVTGTTGRAMLLNAVDFMLNGGFISAYDAYIAAKLAAIFTGGDVPYGVEIAEERILELEREAFISLCGEEKTQQRMDHMLRTGKPLRN